MRWGGRAGGIWGACEKKWFSRGGHPKKNLGKRGSREIFYSNTLKWHIVSISEALDFKRKREQKKKQRKVGTQKINHMRIILGLSCAKM